MQVDTQSYLQEIQSDTVIIKPVYIPLAANKKTHILRNDEYKYYNDRNI